MARPTAFEVLGRGDPRETHSWLRDANIDELRDALEDVKRHDTWGSHIRDALDIRLALNAQRTANRVLGLTVAVVILTLVQVINLLYQVLCHH